MFSTKQLTAFGKLQTPFYHYDLSLLERTLDHALKAAGKEYRIHYALKANANPVLLEVIRKKGFGADCVSGNEVSRAIESGFSSDKVVFAGVGKSDKEIETALGHHIFCFNAESIPELQVINEIAGRMGKKANIAIRINPNVDAYTHKYITTGLEENKFGINPHEFEEVISALRSLTHLNFIGLHFHIGSQITDLTPFRNLCQRVNEINQWFVQKGFLLPEINLGGGLGIDYRDPDAHSIVDFDSYFEVFRKHLELRPGQHVHFELGRALVAQCGTLISRVLYVKKGIKTNFAILDAGMTELIRPALYQAYHKIDNISAKHDQNWDKYDVVGPICESSDCFGKAVHLPTTNRGDLIAIRSAGAYGEVMSSRYNLRDEIRTDFTAE